MDGRIKHGGWRTPLYAVWCEIKQRCSRRNHHSFSGYGGRGIKVCDDWLDFATFRAWAESHGYRPGLEIDREDNDGDYSPNNCCWTTRFLNNAHKRTNRLTMADALVIRDLASRSISTKLIAALYGVKMACVSQIKSGYSWRGATLDALVK